MYIEITTYEVIAINRKQAKDINSSKKMEEQIEARSKVWHETETYMTIFSKEL